MHADVVGDVAQDERPAEPPVVVIGHALWESRFDADSSVVDINVKLGGQAITGSETGVLPAGATGQILGVHDRPHHRYAPGARYCTW